MANKHYNLREKILINLVNGGSILVMVIINSSLMKYFTDVINFSPAMYGTVFLIFSIWNGINDPVIGFWADRRRFIDGKGKYRPLIRWAIPVIGVSVIALFFASPGWNQLLIAAYLLILLVVYEAAQTLLQVSFGAFMLNAFLSTEERTQFTVIQNYVNMIPVFIGGMIPVWFLTGEFSQGTLAAVFTGAVLLGLLLIAIGQRFIREDSEFYERMEVSRGLSDLWKLGKSLFRDRTFLLFILAFFFIQAATGSYFTGYLYYMDNVLVVSGLRATIPDVLTGVVQMAIFPLIVLWVRKNGSRSVLGKGMLIAVAGHLILFFPVNYWFAAAAYIIILSGYAFSSATLRPIEGLVVDHIELKTGKRQPGVVRGLIAVIFMPAASVQTLILSGLLESAGYDGSVKAQSAEAVRAIRVGTGLVPALILLTGIILLTLIPLSHKREKEIQAAIEKRHSSVPDTASQKPAVDTTAEVNP